MLSGRSSRILEKENTNTRYKKKSTRRRRAEKFLGTIDGLLGDFVLFSRYFGYQNYVNVVRRRRTDRETSVFEVQNY